jgi:hypothetical protein
MRSWIIAASLLLTGLLATLLFWSESGPRAVQDVGTAMPETSEGTLDALAETTDPPTSRAAEEVGPASPALAVDLPVGLSVRCRGRVVGEGRFPVAGATVELAFPMGSYRATSDATGEVVVVVPRPAERAVGTVHASEGSRAFTKVCVLWPSGPATDVDLGELVLAATHGIRVQVLAAGRPAAGVEVTACPQLLQPLAHATTDDQGRARFDGLPEEWYTLRARSNGSSGWARVVVPDDRSSEALIELLPLRTVAVRTIDRKTGQPLAGVWFEVEETCQPPELPWRDWPMGASSLVELGVPVTDAEGHTVIEGLDARSTYRIRAWHAGQVREQQPREQLLGPDQDELEFAFTLSPTRTLRWPVVAGELPVPAEGTPFDLVAVDTRRALLPPPWEGRMVSGELVVEDWWGWPTFEFRAPDGSLAIGAGRFEPIAFRRPRRLKVTVLAADGAPVAGLPLEVSMRTFDPHDRTATTDADGRGTFEGLFPGSVEVFLPTLWQSAGRVDLEDGDGTLVFQLDPTATLLVHLRVAGEPHLPGIHWIWSEGGDDLRAVREDPGRGEVEFETRRMGLQTIRVWARGFQQLSQPVDLQPGDPPAEITFDLLPACTLRAHVTPPDPSERRTVEVEQWSERLGDWTSDWSLQAPNENAGSYRFEGLAPVRTRVRVSQGPLSIVSDEVLLEATSRVHEVRMDLAAPVRIEGRVEGPPDLDPTLAHVILEGEGAPEDRIVTVRPDATFALSFPAGSPPRLTVWHPFLTPADAGPVEASSGVVLRLRHGQEVQIPLEPEVAGLSWEFLRVLRFAGDPGPDPLDDRRAPIVDGVVRLGGVSPGVWTLWLDPHAPFAPVALRIHVTEDVTRVDPPRFTSGSTLRIRAIPKAGREPPWMTASAQCLGPVPFLRNTRIREGVEVLELPGLCAGQYTVTLSVGSSGIENEKRPLEVDGTSDVEWTLDLR